MNFRCLPLGPVTVTVARDFVKCRPRGSVTLTDLIEGALRPAAATERQPRMRRAHSRQRHVRDRGGALDDPFERGLAGRAARVGDGDRHARVPDPLGSAGDLAGRAVDGEPARQTRGRVADGLAARVGGLDLQAHRGVHRRALRAGVGQRDRVRAQRLGQRGRVRRSEPGRHVVAGAGGEQPAVRGAVMSLSPDVMSLKSAA